jgi:hypothetical protein
MRFSKLGAALLVSLGFLCAQAPESPEVARAKAGIEKLRQLVEAGAAPRAQLERAEEALTDAEDVAYLRRTLYGQDLTEDQAEEMIVAAERRLERRQRALAQARQLVEEGVTSQLSLGTFLEELDLSRKEYDLAVSRAKLLHELAEMARAEQTLQSELERMPGQASRIAERYDGAGKFSPAALRKISRAFEREFAKALPISALGETAVHRALGFDHRNRVDVALHPDQPEGVWLRDFLAAKHIPYFAFRQAVPGKATAAHIHIGPMSGRISPGG